MIRLTKLTGQVVHLNAVHIESVERCPDTRVALTNGKQIYVRESCEAIAAAVTDWYRQASAVWHGACGEPGAAPLARLPVAAGDTD